MEILVTGATGFIGPHLVTGLRGRGCSVRILARPNEDTTQFERQGIAVHRGDLRNAGTLISPFQGVDAVFNLAAVHGLWRARQEYYDVNVAGAENVCRAALAAGIRRLVHMSTWTVCGFGLGRPVSEDLPLKAGTDTYQITKVESDRIVQRYIAENNLPATIVRPSTIFGPGDGINFSRMAERLCAGKAVIIGSGRNAVPFLYISDLVDGMIRAAFNEKATGQIYNIGHDQPLTQEEMWRCIAAEIGVNPPRLRVPYHFLYPLGVLAEKLVDRDNPKRQPLVTRYGVQIFGTDNRQSIEKARRELGYAPQVSLRDGIRMTAEWYLNQQARSESEPEAVAMTL
ncbi:MAG: NAD-dependent epimerase/dehydratase family protein [Verrucomicrobiota bacterium]